MDVKEYSSLVEKLAEEIVDNALIEKQAGVREAAQFAGQKGRQAAQFAGQKGRQAAQFAGEKGREAAQAVGRKARHAYNDASFVAGGAKSGAKRRMAMLRVRNYVQGHAKQIGVGAGAGAGLAGAGYVAGRQKRAFEEFDGYNDELALVLEKAAAVYEDAQFMKQAAQEVLEEAALYEDAADQIFNEAGLYDEEDYVDDGEDYVDDSEGYYED